MGAFFGGDFENHQASSEFAWISFRAMGPSGTLSAFEFISLLSLQVNLIYDFFIQDITAKVIADIVRTRRVTQEEEICAAFHIVNPKKAEWESLIPAITKYFDVELVDVHTWVKTLEGFTNPTESDLKDKPALKILDFFKAITYSDEAGPSTETIKTEIASKTLKNLKEIDAPLFENWMKQWNF